MKRTSDAIEITKQFRDQGCVLFPLIMQGKGACVKGWSTQQWATTSAHPKGEGHPLSYDEVFDMCLDPTHNVGILLGTPSNLIAIDCDDKETADDVMKMLPETSAVMVSGSHEGVQLFYRCPDVHVPTRNGWNFTSKGKQYSIEIRSESCQSVIPGCIHKSGYCYEMYGVDSVEEWFCNIPVYHPSWFPGSLEGNKKKAHGDYSPDPAEVIYNDIPTPESIKQTRTGWWYTQYGHNLQHGDRRNNILFYAACDYSAVGIPVGECKSKLVPVYVESGGGGGAKQAEKTIDSAYSISRTATYWIEGYEYSYSEGVWSMTPISTDCIVGDDEEDKEHKTPECVDLDLSFLHPAAREFVEKHVDAVRGSAPLAVGSMFAVISAYLLKKVEIEYSEWGNTHQYPTLYILCVCPSGVGKSRTMRPIFAPFSAQQKILQAEHSSNTSKLEDNLKILAEERRKLFKKTVMNAITEKQLEDKHFALQNLPEIEEQIKQLQKQVYGGSCLVMDSTTESIIDKMAEAGEIAVCLSTENRLLQVVRGHYNNKRNYDLFLHGFDGETYTHQRRGSKKSDRIDITFDEPLITFCNACTTEDWVKELLSDKEFCRSGFMQRIMSVFSKKPAKKKRGKADTSYMQWWLDLCNELNEIKIQELPDVLTFSQEAENLLADLEEWVDNWRDSEAIYFTNFWGEWMNRYVQQIIHVAGILHVLEHKSAYQVNTVIQKSTVASAQIFVEFVRQNLLIYIETATDNEDEQNAQIIMDVMKQKGWETITPAKWIKHIRRIKGDSKRTLRDKIDAALALLVRQGSLIKISNKGRNQWVPPHWGSKCGAHLEAVIKGDHHF